MRDTRTSCIKLFEKSRAPLLGPDPSISWASGAVFNPGAWYDGQTVHLLFRAIPRGYEAIDLEYRQEGEPEVGFSNYVSYIGYASARDGVTFKVRSEPFLRPDADHDRFGAEDPRISLVDGRYLITYSALQSEAYGPDPHVRIGLATTTDFVRVEKIGVIGPDERDKNAVIFPGLVRGRIAMLHRIVPNIQLIYFDDLEQLCYPPEGLWSDHISRLEHHILLSPQEDWEALKIGAGPTPLATPEGWLLVYHAVDARRVYRAGLALLDLDDPSKVIARTDLPVLEPELGFEKVGDVDNVVFPQGAVIIDDKVHVYYGAADRYVGRAAAPLRDILDLLKAHRI